MNDAPQTLEANEETTAKPLVLVIEDDLFFSVRIEKTLAKMGYEPLVIADSEAAFGMAEQRQPALVIINFGGEHHAAPAEVTRKIKTLPNPPPVLGYVSHVWMPQVRPNAMEAGCDLLVANSALTMRLPQLVEKLAPIDTPSSS